MPRKADTMKALVIRFTILNRETSLDRAISTPLSAAGRAAVVVPVELVARVELVELAGTVTVDLVG